MIVLMGGAHAFIVKLRDGAKNQSPIKSDWSQCFLWKRGHEEVMFTVSVRHILYFCHFVGACIGDTSYKGRVQMNFEKQPARYITSVQPDSEQLKRSVHKTLCCGSQILLD